jgi:hypothetical protein
VSGGGEAAMEQNLVVSFDGDPVRFTPDGRVSALDAIGALTHSESPYSLCDDVKKNFFLRGSIVCVSLLLLIPATSALLIRLTMEGKRYMENR